MQKRKKEERIYLACPYTCQEFKTLRARKRIEYRRFKLITEISCLLVEQGVAHFSPITQSHIQKNVANEMGITFVSDWETWKNFDLMMLRGCTELYVARFPGWENSVGLNAEIKFAERLKMPISWVDYDEEGMKITVERRKI